MNGTLFPLPSSAITETGVMALHQVNKTPVANGATYSATVHYSSTGRVLAGLFSYRGCGASTGSRTRQPARPQDAILGCAKGRIADVRPIGQGCVNQVSKLVIPVAGNQLHPPEDHIKVVC